MSSSQAFGAPTCLLHSSTCSVKLSWRKTTSQAAVNSSSPEDHQKACNPGTVLWSLHCFQQDYFLIPISFLSLTYKERKGSHEKWNSLPWCQTQIYSYVHSLFIALLKQRSHPSMPRPIPLQLLWSLIDHSFPVLHLILPGPSHLLQNN